MTNYNELSDFEINERVAEVLGIDTGWRSGDAIGVEDGSEKGGFADYCNNPSDAWPIIADYKIGIWTHPTMDGKWSARINQVTDVGAIDYIVAQDVNPLRAAMIVYLMMKEADNEQA